MPAGEVFVDIYADHGCSYAPSCLQCPFEVCRYDRGFAGNRITKAMSRVERDQRITEMRKEGMQVEHIASAFGVSGRTVARILSRKGPSMADVSALKQHDEEVEHAALARSSTAENTLRAMGLKQRKPLPVLRPGAAMAGRNIYNTGMNHG